MALLGGGVGGAGNPVGGSFTGPAEALEIYGDFAAAYTGLHAATTAGVTVLSFTSGNYLFVGEFQLNGAVHISPFAQTQTTAQIKLNGVAVSVITTGNVAIDVIMTNTQALIIPAYTEVTVEFDMTADEADRFASGSLTGRIYRE